ncbi:hypothetical protein BD289DRAFT_51714 [Coniella lustricola]|uniref:Uncharacterized protein n=1 Tax=Coniella lustricola TaxID=2025994 RepID=A0A2T3A186_9PEZI|nr:hypothetical protein BD289DRAFT_51714 [Coniella lustricola]
MTDYHAAQNLGALPPEWPPEGLLFENCLIEANHLSTADPLSVSMRIFYESSRSVAFFRLRTSVPVWDNEPKEPDAHAADNTEPATELATEPATESDSVADAHDAKAMRKAACSNKVAIFYLDIQPSVIRTMTLHRNTIQFSFESPDSIKLIAPNSVPPLHPTTVSGSLAALGFLATSSVVRVLLPVENNHDVVRLASMRQRLEVLCSAINRDTSDNDEERLHPKPQQIDTSFLYRGKGGRTVDIRLELLRPTGPTLPPYSRSPAASQSPDTKPGPSGYRPQKRLRTLSSSEASTSASIERTVFYRQPDVDETDEMIQRLIDKETQVRGLLRELDMKTVRLNRQTADQDFKSAEMDKKSRAMDRQLVAVERAIRALEKKSVSVQKLDKALDKRLLSMNDKIAIMDERHARMDAKCDRLTALVGTATRLLQSLTQVQAHLTDAPDSLQDDDVHDAIGVPAQQSI